MKVKLLDWLSKILLPKRNLSYLPKYALAFALLGSINGWSQCSPAIAGVSNITSTSAKINWNAVAVSPAPTYTLEVYTDAEFTGPAFGTYPTVAGNSYALTSLVAGTTYYFRIKSNNSACADYSSGSFVAQMSFTPLDVTGFNFDVIANGTGGAISSTTNSVDSNTSASADFAYLSRDYKLNSSDSDSAYGLPVNRSLTSPTSAELKYILQDYSANNSLRLSASNDSGTLTLTQPAALTNVYLAVASGDGGSTIDAEIQFADGTFQTVTGLPATNWDDPAPTSPIPSPAIITQIGRVKRATGVAGSGNFKIFQLTLNIELANQTKLVNAIKITKTTANATESKIPNIFAVSGKLLSACPSIASASTTTNSGTSGTLNWVLSANGTGGSTITYTVEVYTDETYTTHVTGSPFTGLTTPTQQVTGLTIDTPYYYRIKANNGTCDSDYITGTLRLAYCIPTTSSTSNNITNFTTTGGYTNISNSATPAAAYTNFSNLSVSKPAGTSFNFNGTRSSTSTKMAIYVDWNGDLDFDDAGETIVNIGGGTTYSGVITIPAGTAIGSYRLRLRSTSTSYNLTPCGNIFSGETEDYTLQVVAPPADCTTPDAPTLVLSGVTTSNITGTVTPAATAPTGYVLIRSTSPTLSAAPATGAQYSAGGILGGGDILAVSATLTTFTEFVAPNTHYYYFVYPYNENGIECFGPKYGTPATANATTCAIAAKNAGASDVTDDSARLNWHTIVGTGGTPANYTVEVYKDAALTNLLGSYPSTTNNHALTGLTNGATYYYRVKGSTALCSSDAWSATESFTTRNSYSPLSVTGYNADVIANGTGIARVSTTNAVDAVSNSYIARDYENVSGTVATIGLPINRILTSGAISDLKFLLADYSGNNALRLPAQDQTGTLTLVQPQKLSNVYLSVTSGSGGSTISAEINFQDGSVQPATSITLIDWYAGASGTQPALISNIGRANRENTTGGIDPGNSKVFYVTIPVTAENQTKLVSSVIIKKTSAGLVEPVPNIFGISGQLIDECPTLTAATSTPAVQTATINWTNSATAPASTSYILEVYTDATYTTQITGSPFTGITATTHALSGLTPATTYYFRVKGINSVCSSAYVSNSFTTDCLAPAAPTAAAQAKCGPVTVANLTVTGATGATFNWYTAETGGTALAATAAVNSNTYYVSQTVNACEGPRVSVAVTVNTVLAPTAAAQTVCLDTTFAELDVTTVTGATLTWSATEGGAAIPAATAVATGTYFVTQTVGDCTSPATSVALATTTVAAPTATAQTHCTGITFTDLTVTGATGATFTWSATEDGPAITPTTVVTQGTYFVTQTVGTCTSDATSVAVTINTTPVPTATEQTYCIGATVNNLVVSGVTGGTFTWSLTQDGTALEATTPLASGTYFVKQTLNGCVSTSVPVAVTINSTPAPAATPTQTFCTGETVENLAATIATGATFKWSATEDGDALEPTTELVSGTYYVTQTLNTCESTATPVTVVVNSTAAPVASSQSFCIGDTAAQLTATTLPGATVVWSATESGAELAEETLLETGTYYVTQTLNDCVSTATPVSVIVNSTPAPQASAQAYCVGATVEDLIAINATGATVKWFATLGGTVLSQDTALESGTYYVTQTLNLCESTATEVQVTINTVVPPTANAQTFCDGTTAEELSATALEGATLVWSATEGGAAISENTVLVSGTYYVTQIVGDCTSTATPVTVTINEVPNAPSGSATQTFEQGNTIADLSITTITGATAKWYVLEDDVYTLVDTDTVLEDGATYYVTQTTTNCESDYLEITVSALVGRDTFKFANLSVYPNPTKDVITVSNSSAISNVKVVNLLGQTIINQNANTETVQVNLSEIAAGTYILQVNTEGASTSVKVIKH